MFQEKVSGIFSKYQFEFDLDHKGHLKVKLIFSMGNFLQIRILRCKRKRCHFYNFPSYLNWSYLGNQRFEPNLQPEGNKTS